MFWVDRICTIFVSNTAPIMQNDNYLLMFCIKFHLRGKWVIFLILLLKEIVWVWESRFFTNGSVFLCDLDSTGVDAGSSIIFYNNKAATVSLCLDGTLLYYLYENTFSPFIIGCLGVKNYWFSACPIIISLQIYYLTRTFVGLGKKPVPNPGHRLNIFLVLEQSARSSAQSPLRKSLALRAAAIHIICI